MTVFASSIALFSSTMHYSDVKAEGSDLGIRVLHGTPCAAIDWVIVVSLMMRTQQ
jgi:hypothetical protein